MSIYRRALNLHRSECTSARTRRRDFIELAGIYGLILLVIWTPRPWQWGMWAVASVSILAVIAISFDGWRPMGICRQNFCRSLWAVAVAAALSFGAVVMAERLHTLHLPNSPFVFIRHYGSYAIWAGIQQLMLQCFFLSRALRLIPNATAAAGLSACLFAIAHLPNPVLTVITLVFGLAACLIFLHYRNLWPLAMAHAILGIAIAVTIPVDLDHNMRVGISYLTYVNRTVLSDAVAPAKPAARWPLPTGQ
ncbi:MAG TPA: CPBP family intramembrane glutamic endopeptidase [Terracidiphilus sp.]|nr:CPBP family intramembrane glutamic endopeptidase [Terracidiphilus sp.]